MTTKQTMVWIGGERVAVAQIWNPRVELYTVVDLENGGLLGYLKAKAVDGDRLESMKRVSSEMSFRNSIFGF